MNVFDLIVLVVLALFTLRGVMKGMVSQIVSVGSYIVCWIVASRFSFMIAPSIPAEEPWNQVGAMVVLFVITMIGIRFAHGMVEKWVKSWYLTKKANRLLGGGLGFAKGLLICMVLTFFGVMFSESTRGIIFQSKSGLRLSQLIEKTGAFVPGDTCKILRDQLDQYHAKVSGTPIDPNLEAEPIANMIRDSLASLKRSAEEQQNTQGTGGEVSAAFSELYDRGNALLQQVQAFADPKNAQNQAGTSLIDGVMRWFSGASKETSTTVIPQSKQALEAEAEVLFQEAQTYLQKVFKPDTTNQVASNNSINNSISTFGSALATAKSAVQEDIAQNTPAIRPVLQEESMIRRGTFAAEQLPTDIPDVLTTTPRKELSSLLPQSAQPQPSTGLSFLDNLVQQNRQDLSSDFQSNSATEDAMSVPRRTARFMLRKIADDQSRSPTHLLNSTTETNSGNSFAPATIFSPSRLDRQASQSSSL